jgi:hypothetical protein
VAVSAAERVRLLSCFFIGTLSPGQGSNYVQIFLAHLGPFGTCKKSAWLPAVSDKKKKVLSWALLGSPEALLGLSLGWGSPKLSWGYYHTLSDLCPPVPHELPWVLLGSPGLPWRSPGLS